MCDFAADAEAARQLLVGRTLTVQRVRAPSALTKPFEREG